MFPGAHIEARKGTAEEAANYCKKAESRLAVGKEFGTLSPGQGKRTDLRIACAAAKNGDIRGIDEVVFVKYYRGLERLRDLHAKPKVINRKVHIIWGPTAVGKSDSDRQSKCNRC